MEIEDQSDIDLNVTNLSNSHMEIVEEKTDNFLNIDFDFESISKYKFNNNEECLLKIEELEQTIRKLEIEMNTINPNMKVINQYSEIIDEMKKEHEDAQTRTKKILEEFNKIKQDQNCS